MYLFWVVALASGIVIIEGLLFKHGIYSEFLFAQNYKQKPTIQQIQTSYRCASVLRNPIYSSLIWQSDRPKIEL